MRSNRSIHAAIIARATDKKRAVIHDDMSRAQSLGKDPLRTCVLLDLSVCPTSAVPVGDGRNPHRPTALPAIAWTRDGASSAPRTVPAARCIERTGAGDADGRCMRPHWGIVQNEGPRRAVMAPRRDSAVLCEVHSPGREETTKSRAFEIPAFASA